MATWRRARRHGCVHQQHKRTAVGRMTPLLQRSRSAHSHESFSRRLPATAVPNCACKGTPSARFSPFTSTSVGRATREDSQCAGLRCYVTRRRSPTAPLGMGVVKAFSEESQVLTLILAVVSLLRLLDLFEAAHDARVTRMSRAGAPGAAVARHCVAVTGKCGPDVSMHGPDKLRKCPTCHGLQSFPTEMTVSVALMTRGEMARQTHLRSPRSSKEKS